MRRCRISRRRALVLAVLVCIAVVATFAPMLKTPIDLHLPDEFGEMQQEQHEQQRRPKPGGDRAPWEVKRSSQMLIPKRLHHYFSNASGLAPWLLPQVSSWARQHREYAVYFWDAAFVEARLLPRYKAQADYYWRNGTSRFERDLIAKVLILYDVGGVFVELNMRALANVTEYLTDATCVMAQDRTEKAILMFGFEVLPSVSLLACQPRHEFLRFFLRKITEVEFRTGARVLAVGTVQFIVHVYTAALSAFDDACSVAQCDLRDRLLLAEPEVFLPVIEEGYYDNFVTNCGAKSNMEPLKREACYNLQQAGNSPGARSLAVPLYDNPWRPRPRLRPLPLSLVADAAVAWRQTLVRNWLGAAADGDKPLAAGNESRSG